MQFSIIQPHSPITRPSRTMGGQSPLSSCISYRSTSPAAPDLCCAGMPTEARSFPALRPNNEAFPPGAITLRRSAIEPAMLWRVVLHAVSKMAGIERKDRPRPTGAQQDSPQHHHGNRARKVRAHAGKRRPSFKRRWRRRGSNSPMARSLGAA